MMYAKTYALGIDFPFKHFEEEGEVCPELAPSMAIGMFGGFLAATLGGIISKAEFLQGLLYWFQELARS